MSNDNDDISESLIKAGLIAAAGYGIYKMLKSIGDHKKGEEIDADELPVISETAIIKKVETRRMSDAAVDVYSRMQNSEYYKYCDKCREVTGHGACGHCTVCYGGAVGGECNMCD